ncbi:MAG: hypothetical protein AAFO29_03290 [Actinomycetota bacterium]
MYGRCETDPFDQATDVCDSCYGEFCAGCMVTTKGRKHPICKECTIIVSGVRPGAKPLLRGSKKTANKRRKALKEAPQAARAFEYFDEDGSSEATNPSAPLDTEPIEPPVEEPMLDELVTSADANASDTLGSDPADESATIEPAPLPAVLAGDPEPAPLDPGDAGASAQPGPTTPSTPVPPALAGPVPAALAGPGSSKPVSPGLAALAQHQADNRGGEPEPDLSDVPAPAWATEPVDEQPRPDDDAKPVTDGFDWVTELPPRGSTDALPSRAPAPAPAGPADEAPAPPQQGAVATAAPTGSLPRRRSTLRQSDRRQD